MLTASRNETHPNVGIIAQRKSLLGVLLDPISRPDAVPSMADTHLVPHGHGFR